MKVKELINILTKLNMDAEIYIDTPSEYVKVEDVVNARVFTSDWGKQVYIKPEKNLEISKEWEPL